MKDSRESKTKQSNAMPVETWWCKSPCLMQLLGGVRLNADAAVAFFVVKIATQLACWTVIGVVFCCARLVIRSSSVQSFACQTMKHVILFTRATIVLN
jgi:hypothetical protein